MIIEDLLRNPLHLLMLFLVLTMVFGTSKLAEAGKHLGRGIKEFKKEVRADDADQAPTKANAVIAEQSSAALHCSNCGEGLIPGSRFCLQCGQPVQTLTSRQCMSCHAELASNAQFCNSCGAPVGLVASRY